MVAFYLYKELILLNYGTFSERILEYGHILFKFQVILLHKLAF